MWKPTFFRFFSKYLLRNPSPKGFLVNLLDWFKYRLVIFLIIFLISLMVSLSVKAQSDESIQVINSRLAPGINHIYLIPDLKSGQTLTVYVNGLSGNIDPIIALFSAAEDVEILSEEYNRLVSDAIQEGNDPVVAMNEAAEKVFLIWDDDSGSGYDAAFEYRVPKDGNFRLLVTNPPLNQGSGDYQLLIGINAPSVYKGMGSPTGDTIAFLDQSIIGQESSVEEITGALTPDKQTTFYYLHDVNPGSTLYAYVEPISGDLIPTLFLKDYGGKTIRVGNLFGDQTTTTLQYTFNELGVDYYLEVSACQICEQARSGDFRLQVGINEPEVLMGKAEPIGSLVLDLPTTVGIGVKIDQISDVDQRSENYSVVANVVMEWDEPEYAFSPDTCNCNLKTFTGNNFNNFVTEVEGKWPEFSILNQQGNRWTQNKVAAVKPDGSATYIERFSTTLQAPDFNFRQFPFDKQDFYVRILSVFPSEYYLFLDPEGSSSFGEQLGEEEWRVIGYETFIDTYQDTRSRYNFHFWAERNLTFYIVRFFVPLGLIITVSWVTFFLKDYTRRIEVTTGNLLLFIAWSFSISNDLPRLGYLTFMDTIMITTFFISVIVVIFNVILKRLEVTGKEGIAFKIDNYTIWIYPLAYVIAIITSVFTFFSPLG